MNEGAKAVAERALRAFMEADLLFAPHVDSYDYFMRTQLPQILKEQNPFIVKHGDVRLTRRSYCTSAEHPLDAKERYANRMDKVARAHQVRKEAAGRADNGSARLEIELKNIRVLEPSYIDSRGDRVPLSVEKAIQEGRSLNSSVVTDLCVTRIVQGSTPAGPDARETSVCKDFELFLIPRMITRASTIQGVPAAGAFVVNGYLKVIQHQEYLSHNELHMRRVPGPQGSEIVVAQVRCSHTDSRSDKTPYPKWRSTSTLYYKVYPDKRTSGRGGKTTPRNQQQRGRLPRVEVKVPYFTHPFSVSEVLSYFEPDASSEYIQDRSNHARGPNPGEFDTKSHAKYWKRLRDRAKTKNYESLARPDSALELLLRSLHADGDTADAASRASGSSDSDEGETSDADKSEAEEKDEHDDDEDGIDDMISSESSSDTSELENGDEAQEDDDNAEGSHDDKFATRAGNDGPDSASEGSESDSDSSHHGNGTITSAKPSHTPKAKAKRARQGSTKSHSAGVSPAARSRGRDRKGTAPSSSQRTHAAANQAHPSNAGRTKHGSTAAGSSAASKRPKRPPPPTPGVVKNFMKEFYPCAGSDPMAKRTMYLRHVDALLRAYHGKRSGTDRDSMKHRRVRTSGMSLAQLVRQLFSSQMRTMRQLLSKNIDGANIDYVKKLMRQTCITKGIQFAMRGGAWGMKRSQKLKKGVCKMISTTNGLAVLSELRQLKNPIMEEGKNPIPRQLHKDRFGITCASESPEGKTVGLVNTLSVLGCVRTRPVPAWRLASAVLNRPSRCADHVAPILSSDPFPDIPAAGGKGWAVLANGVPFGRVKTTVREFYEAFRSDRRNPKVQYVPATAGFSLWRQDREVRLSAEAGEVFRPLVRIRNGNRHNVAAESAACMSRIILGAMQNEDGKVGVTCEEASASPPHPTVPIHLPEEEGVEVNARCLSMYDGRSKKAGANGKEVLATWHALIRKGPVEYITKSEESTVCIVRERLLQGNAQATHAELHPQGAVMGLSACGVPFANCNQSPRVLYGSAMRKQAFGAPIVDPWIGSHSGFLCNPHRPLVNTAVLRALDHTQGIMGSYCQAAVVAVLPLGGYNQEDSYVVSQGAVDRGLFFSCEMTSRRAHEGQLGTSRIVFGNGDAAGSAVFDDMMMKDNHGCAGFDERGVRRLGSRVRGGDTLVRRELQSREMTPVPGADSGERKYNMEDRRRRHDVRWKASDIERGRVDGIAQWKTGNGGCTVRIRIAQVGPIGVGDKVSSFHGQKGIIARILPDADMPRTASGICPDLCINPHALPSRMTVGQLVELVAGKVACVEGSPVDGTPFAGQTLESLMDRIKTSGCGDGKGVGSGDCRGRELMYSGENGAVMGYVPVGIVSYMALRHRSFRKIQARGMSGRVNCVTKEATEGRRRGGGLRFGEMERDCLIAHGASAILRERLMDQSDGHSAYVCRACGRLAFYRKGTPGRDDAPGGEPWCATCASSGVADAGSNVVRVRIPYAMRVVYNNLAAQNIHMKLRLGVEPRVAPSS